MNSDLADSIRYAFEGLAVALNTPTGDAMRTEQFYRDQADEMLARAALAARIAATPDNYDEGTVVRFTRTVSTPGDTQQDLAYAARKVTVDVRPSSAFASATTTTRWFVTGTTSRQAFTWERLLDFIGMAGLATLEIMAPGTFPFVDTVKA